MKRNAAGAAGRRPASARPVPIPARIAPAPAAARAASAAVRLQKLLAEAGLGSRRAVEDWIRAGRVTVGGRKAQLGDRASVVDDVRLDGKRLRLAAGEATAHELLLYYKPTGEVTTRSDPEGRPTVFERLPAPRRGRWISVGRLDVNTTGLLLLTTDGRLAHRLMHPSSEVEREYLVRLRGRPSEEVLAQLLLGVRLEDGAASFARITADTWEEAGGGGGEGEGGGRGSRSHSTFRVVLTEGRNREVRRLWLAVGFEVSRLKRTRYGPIELPRDLKPGGTRLAGPAFLQRLAQAVARPPALPAKG
ncbi:MAG TPA: pseudouridine synthase [Gemmatimonadales bacterium]|nr:pseudouridine synthase [Gemmatimonadales bacterium]